MADTDPLDWLAHGEPDEIRHFLDSLSDMETREWGWHWPAWARPSQLPPRQDWRLWLILAGRGFGKTRAGAEWVRQIAENDPTARIALIGASLGEARAVMVEGESGLLAICPPRRRPTYESSLRRVTWPNGAQATLYSAAEPESLRGPQHSHAWCDEIAKWDNAAARAMLAWDNLMMGLRLGENPQVVATTTPRAVPLLRRLLAMPDGLALTRGTTWDNAANLPQRFLQAMRGQFGASQLGRQELEGEMLEDVEGALWSRALIERCRRVPPACSDAQGPTSWRRVVVGIDPPAGTTGSDTGASRGDACGIIVVGLDDGGTAHVLADASLERAGPERWARAAAGAAQAWQADRVVAEANQGGAMVGSVLRAANLSLPLRLVHASRGKVARAEPVAALYEAGRVVHAGLFPALEDELCGLMAGGSYQGPTRSPDRADALVWALSELMLSTTAPPRVHAT